MLSFEIGLVDSGVTKALADLREKMTNVTPVLTKIGVAYKENTDLRFKAKQSPEGKQWKRNTKLTTQLKTTGFKTAGGFRPKGIEGGYSMGVWTGNLKNSIAYRVQGNNILVGIFSGQKSAKYASVFQFGAKKGDFGGSRRGNGKKFMPIPWGDIPARPFLGFNKATNEKVLKIIKDHLLNNP